MVSLRYLLIFIISPNASSLTKTIIDISSWPTWSILHHHLENSLRAFARMLVIVFLLGTLK